MYNICKNIYGPGPRPIGPWSRPKAHRAHGPGPGPIGPMVQAPGPIGPMVLAHKGPWAPIWQKIPKIIQKNLKIY